MGIKDPERFSKDQEQSRAFSGQGFLFINSLAVC